MCFRGKAGSNSLLDCRVTCRDPWWAGTCPIQLTVPVLGREPGGGPHSLAGVLPPSHPRLTEPPFSLPGGMADSPREGKLARGPDFTQLVDMACESVGGKVSGGGYLVDERGVRVSIC